MWKTLLSVLGPLVGGFFGFELAAWIVHDSFSGGGLAGLAIGLPLGALLGIVTGFCIGRAIDGRGGVRNVPRGVWLIVLLVLGVLTFAAVYMASIRPFYWIQT